MRTTRTKITIMVIAQACCLLARGQQADSAWTLQRCIDQALKQNIQVQQSGLTNEVDQLSVQQAKASRYPSLSASAGYNYGYARTLDGETYGDYAGQQSSSYAISSSVTLYNGFKTQHTIRQTSIAAEASKFDTETEKESVSLDILDAYLQVLYAEEQVSNTQKQVDLSSEELRLATERQNLGIISKADYLEVKSQLSTERSTLATAQKTLAISRVTLLQLMELPASSPLEIAHPDLDVLINKNMIPSSDSVYARALEVKPEVKSADLALEVSKLDEKIARADYMPKLTLSGEIGTGHSSTLGLAYDYQVKNKVTPALGLSLVIPIYQNKQVKTSVSKAQIGVKNAELSAQYTRNQLRKKVEQASVDVSAAQKEYEASKEEYDATQEAYQVAAEKFSVGMLSSVDFLTQKTRLITAESGFLQAKYSLVFSYKTLDFYSGIALSL